MAALAAALDAVVTIDHRGHVLDFNRAAEETFGYRREDVLGRELAELIVPPAAREAHRRGLARWTSAGPAEGAGALLDTRLEVVAQNARGEEFPVELAISRLDVEGPPLFTACVREISERRRSEEKLRAAELRYRSLVEQLHLVVYVDEIAPGSPNLYTSPQVEPLLGYPAAEWRQDPGLFVKLLHPDDRERVLAAHDRIGDDDDPLSLEYRLVARDGRMVWVRDEGRVVLGSGDAPAVLQGYLLDITAAKAAEERLRHQAFHDPLTSLPNRTFFKERVEAALAAGGGVEAGMLIVDLDDFKAVNDRFGHPDGGELLRGVGERLRRVLPQSVLLARLGGDEFGVLIDPDDEPGRQAVGMARVVTEAFRSPFTVAGVEVFVTSSVGVAVGHDVDELFRQADVAMYRAKSDGKAHHVVYAQAMNEAVLGRLALIGELRRARVDEDFVVHCQPFVDLETGRVLGAEALLRWQHETRGIVSPADFIPAAEESGLIVPIGRFVLEEACRQAAHWRRSEPSGALTVSVNVSVRQFQHPGFLGDVQKALTAAELEPGALVLEITEGVVIRDPDAAGATLQALRRLGVGLALDDFGTGYSSLSLLETPSTR